jgi:hypothetical protein
VRQITRLAGHYRARDRSSQGQALAILSRVLTFVGFVVPNGTFGRGTYSAMTCHVTRDAGLPAVAIPCGAPFCAAQGQSLAAAYIRRGELFSERSSLFFSLRGIAVWRYLQCSNYPHMTRLRSRLWLSASR